MIKIPKALLFLCLMPFVAVAEEEVEMTPDDYFAEGETFEFRNDIFTVTLRYTGYPEDRSARVAVESFELQSLPDLYWVSEEGRFMPFPMVNLIGQGFAAGPLRIKVEDQKQLEQWQSVLAEAVNILQRIPEVRADLIEKHGEIPAALRIMSLDLGEVYSYPKKKPMSVRFEANFAQREYALLIGETIRLTDYSLEAVEYLLSNVGRYLEKESELRAERDDLVTQTARRLRGE